MLKTRNLVFVGPKGGKTEVVPATNNDEPPKHLTPYALGGTTDNNMPNDLTTTPPINPPDVLIPTMKISLSVLDLPTEKFGGGPFVLLPATIDYKTPTG